MNTEHEKQTPIHGTERNRGFDEQFKVLAGGASMMEGRTVSERYCTTCGEWVKCEDLFAHMQCPQCHTRW